MKRLTVCIFLLATSFGATLPGCRTLSLGAVMSLRWEGGDGIEEKSVKWFVDGVFVGAGKHGLSAVIGHLEVLPVEGLLRVENGFAREGPGSPPTRAPYASRFDDIRRLVLTKRIRVTRAGSEERTGKDALRYMMIYGYDASESRPLH